MVRWYDDNADQYAERTWGLDLFPGLESDLTDFCASFGLSLPALDVGSGGGRDAEYMARAGKRVLCLDTSEALLDIVRRRCSSTSVATVRADMLEIPLKENSVGGVWASGSLLHLKREQIPMALEEISRVLVPGGPLGISMKLGVGSDTREDGRIFTLVSPNELQGLLAKFRNVRISGPARRDWLYALCFAR